MFADFTYLPYPGDGTTSDYCGKILVIWSSWQVRNSCFIHEPHRSVGCRYSANAFRMPVSKYCQGNCIEDQPLQGRYANCRDGECERSDQPWLQLILNYKSLQSPSNTPENYSSTTATRSQLNSSLFDLIEATVYHSLVRGVSP